jgi:hypothetical protein
MDGIATQAGMFTSSGGGTTFPAPTHYWDLDTTGFVDSAGGWTLTENDGTITIDSTGGPDGGPAADLNPVGEELIRVGGEYWDGVQDNITVSIWAKIDNLSSVGNWLFSWRGNSTSPNDRFVQIIAFNNGTLIAQLFDLNGIIADIRPSGVTVSTGVWCHFVLTHDGSQVKFYLDGVQIGSQSTPSFSSYPSFLMPLALGVGSWATTSTSTAHDGMLAKCGLWDVALTGSEINTLYNSGDGLNYADL